MPSSSATPFPKGTVLLHIGPHKTGTTALQGAFHSNRDALAEHGVHYAGRGRQPMLAALAMTGRPGRRGDTQTSPRRAEALAEEVAGALSQRVVVSTEFLADASADAAREAVRRLGGPRAQVVVTLRPLGRIMPSQWQQYVQNGLRARYDVWLDHMLNKPPYNRPTPSFWYRHSHDQLVQRWVAATGGPDKLTVVVLDESDRGMVFRTFERLLDLPEGLLVPESGVPNRSLSLGEVEVIRLLNHEFRRQKWSNEVYGRFIRNAVAKQLLEHRRPAPGEPVITTPKWAMERAAEIGTAAAASIAASGVRVIGDLASLGAVLDGGAPDKAEPSPDPLIPASAAAIALIGTITASGQTGPVASPIEPNDDPEVTAVGAVDTRTLARVVAARVRRRAGIKMKARRPR
ncbi:MAG: hypothetical protein QOJ03_431 [Frankiaceae bacterium]|nr:hypothetical protein [Frankiaceae bacterium]